MEHLLINRKGGSLLPLHLETKEDRDFTGVKLIMLDQTQITKCLESYLLPSLPQSPPDVEALRLYLILPEYHMFEEPKKFSTLIGPFANSILNLDKPGSKVLDYWWGSLKPRHFSRILSLYKQTVIYLLQLPQSQIQTELFSRNIHIKFSLEIMKKLNKVNELNGQIIPYNHFYIPELRDKVDIRADYVNWVQQSRLINSVSIVKVNNEENFDFIDKFLEDIQSNLDNIDEEEPFHINTEDDGMYTNPTELHLRAHTPPIEPYKRKNKKGRYPGTHQGCHLCKQIY
ncbi:HERC4 [Mytilus coruscus]|uniref:HERC4 n=1 Tax=Mytilus coruscus TaxID=42192 RepID=A0A6J8AK69_MYTCO|nr:HERC4 [Mytilus coruscus]